MTATQYDTLDNQTLQQLAERGLRHYPLSLNGRLRLLCRSENATFRLDSDDGRRFALRLHRANYHRRDEIESELSWLDALNEQGIQVPQAVRGADGERVQNVVLEDGSVRHLVIFDWIDGEMPTTGVDPRAFLRLGEITAQLHQHSRTWRPPAGFRRIVWDHPSMIGEKGHWGCWREAPYLARASHRLIEEALVRVNDELLAYGQAPQRYGLIHADLRLSNLLLQGEETRVIDFDDCGFGWYLHDLAAAISFVEHHPRAQEWVAHWLAGYQHICPLDERDLAMVPTFIIQRRIQLLAWAGSHAETEMARSLGDGWATDSVRLCRRYLETDLLPVGSL
ncbi:phosphotransferase [Serratia ficaria]|uniref:Serine/threonine protein kinase n=1 Tax=Serratia ficaria TaxID=61651 RepID=A0A240B5K8_SERFI|nr:MULTISPECIES: phosphotransferase [Serratia]MEE4483136.1 phosphotransferase [Serratia ficaria]REF46109.1 Ser/Thr protein kinase RdoA (MazF antagonist) [Serratia ficaria]CAI0863960.1 serine/threonine protein kinase [Serratia ficaria]CAI0940236.1 serine/threonine protein kinase [Serratia ficaria]CAI1005064.1 serine/threonine protein kinase [Serratia ficaria]